MRLTKAFILYAVLCGGLISKPAIAQDLAKAELLAAREAAALVELRRFAAAERSLRGMRQLLELSFSKYDLDGGGVAESDSQLAAATQEARMRAQLLQKWLQSDLDGDGRITREELRRVLTSQARRPLGNGAGQVLPTEEQVEQVLEQLIANTDLPDTDGDGVTTLDEMMAAAKIAAEQQFSSQRHYRNERLSPAFDVDGDGVISRAEYVDTVLATAKRFDLDEDGFLDQSESEVAQEASREASRLERQRQSQERRRQREEENAARKRAQQTARNTPEPGSLPGRVPVGCVLPRLGKASDLAVVSAFASAALSTAHLGNPRATVGYGEIDIQPGTKPLYLVLRSAGSMIFRLSGQTDKIRQVVIIGARSAVAGVARDKVAWIEDKDCGLQTTSFSTHGGLGAKRIIGKALGRVPDLYAHLSHFGLLRLPSGPHVPEPRFERAVAPDSKGPAAAVWARFDALRPGGLVYVRLRDVVSKQRAGPYKLLPQEAGLAQLVERGKLELIDPGKHTDSLPTTSGGGVVFHGVTIVGGGNDVLVDGDKVYAANGKGGFEGGQLPVFRILEPVTLPPGLHAIHSAIFKLPEGIAKPEGELGAGRIERE